MSQREVAGGFYSTVIRGPSLRETPPSRTHSPMEHYGREGENTQVAHELLNILTRK